MKLRLSRLPLLLALIGLCSVLGCGGGGKGSTSSSAPVSYPPAYTVSANGNGTLSTSLSTNDLLALYNTSTSTSCSYEFALTPSASIQSRRAYDSTTHPITPSERFYESLREQGRIQGTRLRASATRAQTTPPVVGSSRSFRMYTYTGVNSSYITVYATLKRIGEHCYVYVDNNVTAEDQVDDTRLNNLVSQWDSVIYPSDITYFGDTSDINSDGHISLLLSHFPDFETDPDAYISGFFNPTDLYDATNSNRCEILYYNTETFKYEEANDYGTLAHELQHLINYNYKGSAEWTSIDEGLSELAMDRCGYGLLDGTSAALYRKIQVYEEDPASYSAMIRGGSLDVGNYAAAYLFMAYIYDRFGATKIKELVTKSDKVGPDNISNVTGVSAAQLFHDWVITSVMDSMNRSSTKYFYTSVHLSGTLNGLYTEPLLGMPITSLNAVPQQTTLAPWTMCYYRAPQGMTCTVLPSTNASSLKGIRIVAND